MRSRRRGWKGRVNTVKHCRVFKVQQSRAFAITVFFFFGSGPTFIFTQMSLIAFSWTRRFWNGVPVVGEDSARGREKVGVGPVSVGSVARRCELGGRVQEWPDRGVSSQREVCGSVTRKPRGRPSGGACRPQESRLFLAHVSVLPRKPALRVQRGAEGTQPPKHPSSRHLSGRSGPMYPNTCRNMQPNKSRWRAHLQSPQGSQEASGGPVACCPSASPSRRPGCFARFSVLRELGYTARIL